MNIVRYRRVAGAVAVLGTSAALVSGCATPSPSADQGVPSAATGLGRQAAPGIGSRIDPSWMGFPSSDGLWKVLNRLISHDRQEFTLEPSDETHEYLSECSVCNPPPGTAFLTFYERGAYDPAAVRTGQPVTVNGGKGFFLAPRSSAGAVLAWQYGENAWATAQGNTKSTGNADRLLQLAARVQPAARTQVQLPLSLRTLPGDMPLSSIGLWASRRQTEVSFDGCGGGKFQTRVAVCANPSDSLSIRLTRDDEFPSYRDEAGQRQEVYTIPVKIGDRTGYVHEDRSTEAAIKVAPGVVIVFELSGPIAPGGFRPGPPTTRFEDVLASVEWTANPADEATWPAVAEWTTSP